MFSLFPTYFFDKTDKNLKRERDRERRLKEKRNLGFSSAHQNHKGHIVTSRVVLITCTNL